MPPIFDAVSVFISDSSESVSLFVPVFLAAEI